MNINGISISASQADASTTVEVAMLSKSLDTLETNGEGFVKLMEQSVTPNLGSNVDVFI